MNAGNSVSVMAVVERGLVPVYADEENDRFVNARELHAFLDVGKDFSNWVKERIEKYGFEEGTDYVQIIANSGENSELISGRGRPTKDYLLTLDAAKEIAMVENNEKGRMVRRYFIEVEKRARRYALTSAGIASLKAELKSEMMDELKRELTFPPREEVVSGFPKAIRIIGDLSIREYKGIPVVSSFDIAQIFGRKHYRVTNEIHNTFCGDTLYEHAELFLRCDIQPIEGKREEHFFLTVNGLELLFRRWGGYGPAWRKRQILGSFRVAERDYLGLPGAD
jgi:phage anti-repressor protein